MKRVLLLALASCGAPEPPATTGGTSVPLGPCGRGLVVIASDYQSSNVLLLDTSGATLSGSFLSSASASSALSAPLSGDVVLPSEPQLGAEIALIDRYPGAVITWASVASAEVRAQLSVATGFASNPHDLLTLADGDALVARFDHDTTPGDQPFDGGSDLLRIDPRAPAIRARIDLVPAMQDAPAFLPRAHRMVRDGERTIVLLSGYSADFSASAPSRVVTVRDGAIDGVTVLDALHGCSAMAVSERRLAVACSGEFAGGSEPTLAGSGIVLLDLDDLSELGRWSAAELGGQPLGFSLAFADEHTLLATALGSDDGPTDALLALELQSGTSTVVLRTPSRPFELGDVACMTPVSEEGEGDCGACFVADAERRVLHRLRVGSDGVAVEAELALDSDIALPPRGLGRF